MKRWGWLLLLATGATLAWILSSRSTTPGQVLELEKQAIDAGEKAKLRELEIGRDQANAEIDHEYDQTIRELYTKQRAEQDRLRSDPGARVRMLNRLSAKRDQPG